MVPPHFYSLVKHAHCDTSLSGTSYFLLLKLSFHRLQLRLEMMQADWLRQITAKRGPCPRVMGCGIHHELLWLLSVISKLLAAVLCSSVQKKKEQYLILLSASHHIEEQIYTVLIDNGHPFQERNLICRQVRREGWGGVLKKEERRATFYPHSLFHSQSQNDGKKQH